MRSALFCLPARETFAVWRISFSSTTLRALREASMVVVSKRGCVQPEVAGDGGSFCHVMYCLGVACWWVEEEVCEWTTRIWPIIAMDTVGQLFSGSYHNYRTHKHTKHIIELANNNFLAEQYNFYPQHQQHPHQHSHPPSRHSSPHPSPTHTPIPHSPHLFIQPPATDIHQHEHREPDPVDQIQDDPPLDEEPLYVNAKHTSASSSSSTELYLFLPR